MKSNIIQIVTSWVEENWGTQTSFVTTVLCADGTVWRQCNIWQPHIREASEWFEITEGFYGELTDADLWEEKSYEEEMGYITK